MSSIKTSDTEKIEITTFKNDKGRFVNVRKFWRKKGTAGSDSWQVGRQGLTIPEDEVVRFVKLLKKEFQDIENAPELESHKKSKKD